MKKFDWKKNPNQKEKPTRKSAFEGDYLKLEWIDIKYRDIVTNIRCNSHNWVKSVVVSGERTMGKKQQEFWEINTWLVWCDQCGFSAGPVAVEKHKISSAGKYYSIMNPERTPYKGIEPSFYDRWLESVPIDLESVIVHTDYERDVFLALHGGKHGR